MLGPGELENPIVSRFEKRSRKSLGYVDHEILIGLGLHVHVHVYSMYVHMQCREG